MTQKLLILFILLQVTFNGFGQKPDTSVPLFNEKFQVLNGDTFYVSNLPPVYISPPSDLKDRKELFRY